jgi:phosphoserine phosphatase
VTRVYFVRHPQTTWNAVSRYQGRLEAPLSKEGWVQARLTARLFAQGVVAVVYSSPLLRARSLAQEIALAADCRLIEDERLTELGQTPWEGLYVHEIRARFPDVWRAWHECADEVRFPSGENLRDVQDRAQSVLADIFKRHEHSDVVVVTHSTVVQVMACGALGLSLRQVHRVPAVNASVTTVCGNDLPGRLIGLNATEHLYHSPVTAAIAQGC